MGVAYGRDLRDRVLAAYDRGMKTKQIADLFEVSSSWARRWYGCDTKPLVRLPAGQGRVGFARHLPIAMASV